MVFGFLPFPGSNLDIGGPKLRELVHVVVMADSQADGPHERRSPGVSPVVGKGNHEVGEHLTPDGVPVPTHDEVEHPPRWPFGVQVRSLHNAGRELMYVAHEAMSHEMPPARWLLVVL